MAKNLRRITVHLEIDLAKYSRETNEATLPIHLKFAAEQFVSALEDVGFKVHESRMQSTLSYIRHDFPRVFLRRPKKRTSLRKVA